MASSEAWGSLRVLPVGAGGGSGSGSGRGPAAGGGGTLVAWASDPAVTTPVAAEGLAAALPAGCRPSEVMDRLGVAREAREVAETLLLIQAAHAHGGEVPEQAQVTAAVTRCKARAKEWPVEVGALLRRVLQAVYGAGSGGGGGGGGGGGSR